MAEVRQLGSGQFPAVLGLEKMKIKREGKISLGDVRRLKS